MPTLQSMFSIEPFAQQVLELLSPSYAILLCKLLKYKLSDREYKHYSSIYRLIPQYAKWLQEMEDEGNTIIILGRSLYEEAKNLLDITNIKVYEIDSDKERFRRHSEVCILVIDNKNIDNMSEQSAIPLILPPYVNDLTYYTTDVMSKFIEGSQSLTTKSSWLFSNSENRKCMSSKGIVCDSISCGNIFCQFFGTLDRNQISYVYDVYICEDSLRSMIVCSDIIESIPIEYHGEEGECYYAVTMGTYIPYIRINKTKGKFIGIAPTTSTLDPSDIGDISIVLNIKRNYDISSVNVDGNINIPLSFIDN